jgi:hypothetical protein
MTRPPVLDDTRCGSDYHWSEPSTSIDWQACYNERTQHTAELTATIAGLRTDLSTAQFQRDGLWPLAFVVGVVVGIGLAVLW